SPDIYFQNYAEWARRYTRNGNPLFVPEASPNPEASVHALFTLAGLDAIGFSPFAIETISDASAPPLTQSYDLSAQPSPLIAQHQGLGSMVGVLPEGSEQRQPQQIWISGYVIHVSFERSAGPAFAEAANSSAPAPTLPSGGLLIATGPDEFLLAG